MRASVGRLGCSCATHSPKVNGPRRTTRRGPLYFQLITSPDATKIERSGRSVVRTLTAALIVVTLDCDIGVGASEEALQARLTRIAEVIEPENVLNRL